MSEQSAEIPHREWPLRKEDVAELFGVTVPTINEWLADGLLPHWKINSLVYFDLADIRDHLAKHHRRIGGKPEPRHRFAQLPQKL